MPIQGRKSLVRLMASAAILSSICYFFLRYDDAPSTQAHTFWIVTIGCYVIAVALGKANRKRL